MNEIKIYLKTSGRIAELYKDFDLYEGCYRNSQMSVYVPKSLLYENEDGTFANLVKTGAILTAPNGKKLTTKSYYLDYVKTETVGGIAYAVYTITTPKEFCVYAGTQTVVVNVESIDNTDKDNQKVISVTTTQTANLIVLESAYLGQDEPIEPTELDKIKATLTEIEGDITGLQSKVSDISDKVSTLSDVTTELMSDVDNLSIQVSDLSEDKLDKQSGATAYEEAYVKDTDGSQKMERVTITSIASAIVKRDANGNINIAKGLSGNPKNGANMENIADVEEKISKCPTLDGNNDFTGENTFEEAIQAKKGTVVKNSLDETNYNAGYISRNDWTYLFPADSGTFALTKNIPTDYATQTALANTQRQVDGLYTLLEQKNEIYVQTATDTYTTRETAGGENIADGVQTPVKKITGKTVKTTNLFSGENVTAGNCTYENGVAKQIASDNSSALVWKVQLYKDTTFVSQVEVQFLNTGRTPALTFEKTSDVNRLAFGLNGTSVDTLLSIYISEFPNGEYTITWNVLNITQGSVSWNNIMLNYGSSALPYEPYTQSVLSLPEAVELTEYDTAYPETGEIQRQSKTLTFNGAEYFADYSMGDYFIYTASLQVYGTDSYSGIANNGFVFQDIASGNDMGVYIGGEEFDTIKFWFRKTIFPELNTIDKFKSQLAAWNEAGNPLTVTYKTAEITTEQADFSADSYIAWKNGSETIEQGDTDNSIYGAENTVQQDYYLLTAPEEVTKE